MQRTSGVTAAAQPLRDRCEVAAAPGAGWARRLRGAVGLVLAAVLCGGVPAAQDRYEYDGAGRLIRHIDSSQRAVEYGYDPAGNLLSVRATTAEALRPALASVTPAAQRRGTSAAVVFTGQRLQTGTLSASHPGLQFSAVQRSADRIDAQLQVASDAPVGTHTVRYANIAGTAELAFQVLPALPTVNVEPSPLALPPDNVTRQVVVRLSHVDTVDHVVAFTSSDTTRGTVSPASLTLPAGQTTATISVTPRAAGFFTLSLASATLAPVSVPVFITADFRGVSTSYARPVGVRVGEVQPPAPRTATGLFGATGVGVTVGSVFTQTQPKGLTVGATHALTLQGHGLPDELQASVVPATGATLAIQPGATATQLQASLTLAADAPAGWRRIELRTAAGAVIPQASPDAGLIYVTSGQPEIIAIDPLFSERNRVATLRLRGRHLQLARVQVLPSTDLRVDAAPVISADGTELTVRVDIVALAALGPRTVQVITPSGASTDQPTAANQFTLVSSVGGAVTPIASPLVGVTVGTSAPPPPSTPYGPVIARAGVLVGAGAHAVSPRAGVIGTTVTLDVSGAGLDAVQSAAFVPPEGLTLGTPTVAADGSRWSVPVTIAADAPRSLRRLVLTGAAGRLPFTQADGDQFAVVAPVPEFTAIAPPVWLAGQTVAVTIRGRNLQGVQAVAAVPPEGIMPVAPFNTSADGTQLTFNAQVAAGAASGPRVLRITTPAGVSSEVGTPANTVTIAQQTAGAVTPIASSLVGVQVGDTVPPVPTAAALFQAAPVGVVVNTVAEPVTRTDTPRASPVGVVIGSAARRVVPGSPDGLLKGSSLSVEVQGVGLGAVTGVALTGSGVTASAPVTNAEGTQLTVTLTAAADAPSGAVGLRLLAPAVGGGTVPVPTADGAALSVHVGQLPERLDSVSPIVIEQGKAITLTVRGVGLRDVFAVAFEPPVGVSIPPGAAISWSTDGFGERLTVPLLVAPDAAIGGRVLRLRVPGGQTTAEPLPANTLTVVTPQ